MSTTGARRAFAPSARTSWASSCATSSTRSLRRSWPSIEAEVGANKQTFLLCNHNDDKELQDGFVETLIEFGADGVILSPSVGTTADDVARMEKNGLPVVTVARTVEGGGRSRLYRQRPRGVRARDAAPHRTGAHGLRAGRRHGAHLHGARAARGLRRSLRARGARARAAHRPPGSLFAPTRLRGRRRDGAQSGNLPSAIACCSDTIALGVMAGLHRHGVRAWARTSQ